MTFYNETRERLERARREGSEEYAELLAAALWRESGVCANELSEQYDRAIRELDDEHTERGRMITRELLEGNRAFQQEYERCRTEFALSGGMSNNLYDLTEEQYQAVQEELSRVWELLKALEEARKQAFALAAGAGFQVIHWIAYDDAFARLEQYKNYLFYLTEANERRYEGEGDD